MTFKTWVVSRNNRADSRGKIQMLSKPKSPSPHDLLSTVHHMSCVSCMTNLESNLFTTVTI